MKRFKHTNDYELKAIEQDICDYLDSGIEVYIESGAANDRILSYSDPYGYGEELVFTTTGKIFPKQISLYDYDSVELEEFENNGILSIFVEVQ